MHSPLKNKIRNRLRVTVLHHHHHPKCTFKTVALGFGRGDGGAKRYGDGGHATTEAQRLRPADTDGGSDWARKQAFLNL